MNAASPGPCPLHPSFTVCAYTRSVSESVSVSVMDVPVYKTPPSQADNADVVIRML